MAEIRRYVPGDEGALSALLRRTLLEVNAHYCPKDEIDWLYNRYTPETVAQIAQDGHMYVMTEDGVIVGTGTVVQTGERECEIIALDPLLRRIPARAGLAGSFLLFLLTRDVNSGWLGFEGVRLLALPQNWYRNHLTALLGFPQPGFYSTDYFSLLPWVFLFWTGYYLYRLRRQEQPRVSLPVVTALGRHSLTVYLLHQPVVYGVLWALF